MANSFAYIILILWPFVSLLFYKRLPVIQATFWTIVGGFLILPVRFEIDFPLIPPLGKESVPALAALIGCIYIKKIRIKLLPQYGLERWFVIILLISPIITVFTNQEVINGISGLTLHDAFSSIINQYIRLLPLIIGMQIIKTHDDLLVLLKLLVISALAYSLLILFEIRMSPQLHTWVYGYFPHTFGQQARFGGFRAVVFLGHGLIVSMYLAIVLGAVTILQKQKIRIYGIPLGLIIAYFIVVLILNKTVSGFLLGMLLFAVIGWLSVNTIRRSALLFIFIVLTYPALAIMGLFPHQVLVDMATNLDPERGASLAFRFHHEFLLLEHAQNKLFFGWGGWERNRLEGSVKDGFWIGVFGVNGLVGFVSLFGLVFLSVWRASKVSFLLKDINERHLIVSFALIVSIIMIDQLPNSSFYAWVVFLIGALLGRVNNVKMEYQKNYTKSYIN